MKDRVVQHPNRYQLAPVSGQANTYDFVPVPGGVTAAGTPINKALFDLVAPVGMIVMWGGAIGSIPASWRLCDGTNGTPDLRDKFVVGAGISYGVGAQGGENAHILTAHEMPAHAHSGTSSGGGDHTHGISIYNADTTAGASSVVGSGSRQSKGSNSTGGGGTHSHDLYINNAGGNGAHENRPPFYALCYIQKISQGID